VLSDLNGPSRQSGVLKGPRVQLILGLALGLARTKTTTDLDADDAPAAYHRFHPRWVRNIGGN
jgi:hypothetical protein